MSRNCSYCAGTTYVVRYAEGWRIELHDCPKCMGSGVERCTPGNHLGPWLDRERFDTDPEPLWHGQGTCAACGSTVRVPETRAA